VQFEGEGNSFNLQSNIHNKRGSLVLRPEQQANAFVKKIAQVLSAEKSMALSGMPIGNAPHVSALQQ
jgi:hypothetical protein